MTRKLTGAYVQAWVWVQWDLFGVPTDQLLRQTARDQHEEEGDVEIDEDAKVSRSYDPTADRLQR